MSYGLIGPRNQIEWNQWTLDAFWKEVAKPRGAKNSDYIMMLLKDYANREIPPYCFKKKPYRDAGKTKGIITLRAHKKHSACFHCFRKFFFGDLGVNAVIHHILAIKNGGLDLKNNRVVLCRPCHALVHPWLNKSTKPHTSQGKKKVINLAEKSFEERLDYEYQQILKQKDLQT